MELSYAAYNNPDDSQLPPIPGLFMNDYTATAEEVLNTYGFSDIGVYNYDSGNAVAHTIGYKNIVVSGSAAQGSFQNINNITGGNENAVRAGSGVLVHLLYNTNSYNNDSNAYFEYNNRQSMVNPDSANSQGSNIRPLVVVAVRGTVSGQDWVMDIGSQVGMGFDQFSDGSDIVLNSLFHGTGDTANCTNCNGAGCAVCEGYIPYLDDPIILITGHSLGAAVANLAAHHLSNDCPGHCSCETQCANLSSCPTVSYCHECEERTAADVFAYTFATPTTVNGEATGDTNIYNIMNNNDAVTYMPIGSSRERYGRDFHITMSMEVHRFILEEMDTSLLGFGGHAMPNYMYWMDNLPTMLHKSAREISLADMAAQSNANLASGLLPRVLRVKCPVSVTLRDANNLPIAFESQDPNAVPPTLTNSGIVSWIADDGAKMFFIPYGGQEVNVEVEAYDYGSMTFTASIPGLGTPVESVTYSNVSLYPGKEFAAEISQDTPIEDTELLYVPPVGDPQPVEADPHLKSVSVNGSEFGETTTLTFVTDDEVSEIRFHDRNSTEVYSFTPSSSHVTVAEDGDNSVWTAAYVWNYTGYWEYDVSVKVGEEWYYYDNVFTVTITDSDPPPDP